MVKLQGGFVLYETMKALMEKENHQQTISDLSTTNNLKEREIKVPAQPSFTQCIPYLSLKKRQNLLQKRLSNIQIFVSCLPGLLYLL